MAEAAAGLTSDNTEQHTPSSKVETYVIVSPQWPYQEWQTVKSDEVKEHPNGAAHRFLELPERLSDNATQNIVARSTHLHTFLKQLDNDLKVNHDTSDNNPVMYEINTMIANVVKQLRETNELFKDCRLLKAGSVAEKTKIGKLNEFDFLLVIERFRNRQEFSMFLNINWLMILARDVPENKKLLEMYPSLFETDGDKVYLTNVRDTLTGLFLDLLRNSLLGDWTIVTTDEKRICTSDIATTLHLVSRKHNIDVDVDVCLCISVSAEDISNATSYLKDDRSITYFEYIKCLTGGMKEMEIDVFSIIGSKEHIFSFPTTCTRITVPQLELSRFLHYGASDGRVVTYRLAKCIASYFFPKATKFDGCPRCSHCIVKSYHLKNIILTMMKNYSMNEMWTKEQIPYRLIEVFDILNKCIPEVAERNDKVATVATCCTPGILRLDCISTYNPFTPNHRGQRSNCLFTQDSHKPMHDLSYCPRYEEQLTTGREEIDTKVKQYFDYLNEEHWDSYEVIDKVVRLLHELETE